MVYSGKAKRQKLYLKLFLHLAFSFSLMPPLSAVQSFVYRYHPPPALPFLGIALRSMEGVPQSPFPHLSRSKIFSPFRNSRDFFLFSYNAIFPPVIACLLARS